MEACKDCELAIYCYSESSTWIFRTKQEMEEKKTVICNCPNYERMQVTRKSLEATSLGKR